MNVSEKVKEIVQNLCGLEEIKNEHHLQSDLGLDSMLLVSLLIEIEDSFKIELEESDMNPFDLNTVNDVYNLVNKYCGDRNEKNC